MTTPGFSDSDTEHGSQYSQDDALPEPLTLRGNGMVQSSSDLDELTEHLTLAIQELCEWDESTTEGLDIHSGLIQVPSVIISFLEQAIQCFKLESADSCAWDCLRELCQVSVIEKLLALRRTCHQLAAEENNNNENVAVVSCVDALFAKLGHLVSHIGSYQRDEACPSLPSDPLPQNSFTIGGHREETSLRAALQLPHTLAQLISIIASDHASIAVIRLAIRILFSATVLQCPPGVKFSFPFNCHDALQTFLCKRATELGATDHPDQALEDRTMISMAVSMFAMFDFVKMDELHAQFRPHTQAVLLEHIARILQGNAPDEHEFNPIEPLVLCDASQRLLIDWGVTIPWCWAVWNDDRCTDYDVVLSLTATWLYHLGDGLSQYEAESWEEELELSMAYSPTNAIICLLNLLHRANEMLSGAESAPRQLSVAILRVLLRCCWGIKEVLCVLDNKEDTLAQLSANAFCRLFILLQNYKEELIVKDCIIAGLACVEPSVLSVVLQEVAEDTGLKISERLSANVGNIVRKLGSNDSMLEDANLVTSLKQPLQFLTLLWQMDNSATSFIHPQCTSSILRATLRHVHLIAQPDFHRVAARDTSLTMELLNSFLTALAAMKLCQLRDVATENALTLSETAQVWEVAVSSIDCQDPLAIAAFAAFVVAFVGGKEDVQNLVAAAAWNILGDYVLLVLQGYFLGATKEGLSYVICISVCEAMVALLQGVPGIGSYVAASPWTLSLSNDLRGLRSTGLHGPSAVDSLEPSLGRLVQVIERCTSRDNCSSVADKKDEGSPELHHLPYYTPAANGYELQLLLLIQ